MSEHLETFSIAGEYEVETSWKDFPEHEGGPSVAISEAPQAGEPPHDVIICGTENIRAVAQRLGRFLKDLEARQLNARVPSP